MSLSPAFLDELRARTTLSTLVGKTVKITKAGREFKGCCPFHNEKTPSFYVNDEKGFYHCFGCSAHGDAIRWLTDHRGLAFMDAVKELAASAGMDVPAADPRAAERAERANSLYDVMQAAADWFCDQLASIDGAEARGYVERRGLKPETVKAFGIGFAPDSRGKLKSALARFGEEKLIESGLLISVDGKESYDRFRGRLMIPIRDPRGRVIAFGGRILGTGEPKYLNSPDTPLFDKGRTLYNLDRASAASRQSGRVIVVEGYMDVIALAQAGISEAVAPLGTALTEQQLERLWRMEDVPILCFDGDAAGQKAALRAAQRAFPLLAPGRSLSFATLPAGQDPDDLVQSGGRPAFERVIEAHEPLVDRMWSSAFAAEPLQTPEARAGLRRRLADHVATIADPHVRAQYSQEFRSRFDVAFFPPQNRQSGDRRGNSFSRKGFVALENKPVSSSAKSIGGAGINPVFARAIMAGVLRHPGVILTFAEALAQLVIADDALDRLRWILLDGSYDEGPLDSARIGTICDKEGLRGVADGLLDANGLAFSFAQRQADADVARRDLGMAIEALAARPALDAALAAATLKLAENWNEQEFAEQQRLREALQAADNKLAELAQGDDPSGQ